MPSHYIGVVTPAFLGTAPIIEIKAAPTSRPTILEISGWMDNQNSIIQTIGVGRNATAGTGRTYAYPLPDDSNAPSSLASVITEWSVPPTTPTRFFRRLNVANGLAGNGFRFCFLFPRGLSLTESASIGMWIIATTGNANVTSDFGVNIEIDE